MLAKSFAFVLLALTLSPFNAPFQPVGGTEQQNVLIESLSALRHDKDSRAVIAQPAPESHHVAVTLVLDPQVVSTDCAAFDSGPRRSASVGAYPPLAAVLRV